MPEPLISVILPTYNARDYVCEAIDTILKQTYQNIEIIVVDSSTDDTRALVNQYRDRVRYFYQEPKGVSAARNFGLKQAQGALVAFQDSDDRWFPNRIGTQIRALLQFPDATLVFSDYAMFDHSGVILPSACWPHFKLWCDEHKVAGGRFAPLPKHGRRVESINPLHGAALGVARLQEDVRLDAFRARPNALPHSEFVFPNHFPWPARERTALANIWASCP